LLGVLAFDFIGFGERRHDFQLGFQILALPERVVRVRAG